MAKLNLVGQKFGRLTVIEDDGSRTKSKEILWKCECECGNVKHVRGADLKAGHTKSCGCAKGSSKERMAEISNPQSKWNDKPTKRNQSGIRGVNYVPKKALWRADIGVKGEKIYLGQFKDKADAVKARKEAEQKYWGK